MGSGMDRARTMREDVEEDAGEDTEGHSGQGRLQGTLGVRGGRENNHVCLCPNS